jgi:flavin-binding protein dodecin
MSNHVYKIIQLAGSSSTSIEDAVQTAIAKAGKTVRNPDWFSIAETRGLIKVFDFTLGTHPISRKGTTELGGAKRRSALVFVYIKAP